jgi:tetratricopeptide (TPR) repeat protein
MSGRAGGRGYLIQAVIAVLDALNERDWTECVLEPNIGADKIDLVFRSANGARTIQIKSSQNAFGAAQVRTWAEELETAHTAEKYELRLIGPVTSGTMSVSRVGKVDVPIPEALNISALLERCAHRLDRYLRELGHGPTRPAARELLAEALATRLETLSATGELLSRKALEKLLSTWVAELLPPDASDSIAVPRQLPGPPGDFVGRLKELTAITDAVRNDIARVVVVRGLTGVGKSVLAVRASTDIEQQYSDGQVYLDLRDVDLNPRPVTHVIAELVQAFVPTYPANDDAARCVKDLRTLLNNRRVLILAENAQTAEQVESLIPRTAGSLLVVTTQFRFDLPGAVSLDLDVLPEDDCATLVGMIAPRVGESARTIAQICGYLPLAIRIACGTLNARPDISVDEYVSRLLGITERANLVRAALDASFAHVTEDMRRFMTATAVFPSDFDADGITAVSGDSDEVDSQLAAAIGLHLIQWDDRRQRYALHDLIRAYVYDRSELMERSNFTTRHARYFSDVCSHIDELYREGGTSVFTALNLFDADLANIAAGFRFSAEHAATETVAAETCTSYVRGLTHVMDVRLSPLARLEVLTSGLTAARTLENLGLVVLHMGNLGRVYREIGELDTALQCHRNVLEMATKEGHRQDQAYAHHHIGLALLDKNEFLAGVDHLKEALELSRDPSLALKSLELSTLSNLGSAYLRSDQPAKALEYLRPAFEQFDERSDPRMLAMTMANIGVALVAGKTETPLAIEMLERALGIAEDLDDFRARLAARAALADAFVQNGRQSDALALARAQQSDAASVGYYSIEIEAIRKQGDIYIEMNDIAAARATYESLATIARDRNDLDAGRDAVSGKAKIAINERDNTTAITLLEERIKLASSPSDKARVACLLGDILAGEGVKVRAATVMREALDYYESINHEIVDSLRSRIHQIETSSNYVGSE